MHVCQMRCRTPRTTSRTGLVSQVIRNSALLSPQYARPRPRVCFLENSDRKTTNHRSRTTTRSKFSTCKAGNLEMLHKSSLFLNATMVSTLCTWAMHIGIEQWRNRRQWDGVKPSNAWRPPTITDVLVSCLLHFLLTTGKRNRMESEDYSAELSQFGTELSSGIGRRTHTRAVKTGIDEEKWHLI